MITRLIVCYFVSMEEERIFNMEKEIWKSISGYEGLYEVSNLGRVRSIDRIVNGRNGIVRGNILSFSDNGTGYKTVCLCKDNIKSTKYIHRLVANEFVDNPNNLPDVNHKNERRDDNTASNLEWCTKEYNQNYNNCPLKRRLALISIRGKGVCSYDEKGNKVKEYLCIADVQNDGYGRRNVVLCCQKKRRTCGGLFWSFLGETPIIREPYARRKNL